MRLFSRIPLLLTVLCPLLLRANVVINEIMYHPASETTTEEYLELYNTGAAAVDLSGWQFTSGINYTFLAGTSIPAGGYLVVAANAAAFHAKYPTVTNYVAGWSGILSNSANHVVLQDAAGTLVNEVDYADDGDWGVRRRDYFADWGHRGWTWDSPADGGPNSTPTFQTGTDPYAKGRSLELINANFSNANGQNWTASTVANGTPGTANSVAAGDIAPVISNVAHFPIVPLHTDVVTITAQVVNDEASVPVVTLHWRVAAAVSPYTDPAFTTTPMFDDGAHGDALAGDGVYGATIPAQANGAVIEFYLDAKDGANHTRFWPAPQLDQNLAAVQTQNCLYQVDDTAYAGAEPIYRVIMKPVDKAELVQINATTPAPPYPYGPGETAADQSYSHAKFNTTWISIDGTGTDVHYLTGTRNRGHGSRKLLPQGLNMNFPNSNLWKKVSSLNLNTQYTHSQLFGSTLFRQAGLAGPESRPVQVRWNAVNAINAGSPSFGIYVANEVQDGDFIKHNFPLDDSGNLYRGQRYDFSLPPNTLQEADFTYLAPAAGQQPPDPYRTVWFKHTNTSEDDWTDLINLTQVLGKGTSDASFNPSYTADYQTAVQAVVDVDEWMRFFAVETIVDNTETNISNGYGDDFYLYIGKTDPRAKFIPYDLDTICGQGDTVPGPTTHGLFRMVNKDDASGNGPAVLNSFMKFPAFAPIYYQHLNDLLTTTFATANFNTLVDNTLAGIVPQAQIDSIKSFQNTRTPYLATLVPLKIAVTTGPAVVSGYPHTTTATTNLVGVANAITTRSVKVNGVAATWSAWQAQWTANNVALNPGINRVLIQSFDGSSNEIERGYYDVWYDKGTTTAAGGTIAANTTWTVAGGPYNVTSNLVIASPATLTIQPGATVYLGSGINLTVNNGGKLDAEGTDTQRIRFTSVPGSGASWGGITINGAGASPETRIAYADFANNNGVAGGEGLATIEVAGGTLYLDHANFLTTTHQYVSLDASSFYISNCYFPTTTASFELLHGTGGIKAGGHGIVRESFFGTTTNYNDIMDFTGGNREDGLPIIQYYNNVFMGGSDDQLDLDGTDAWIEGNIFLHSHRSGDTPDSSASISGGSYDFGSGPGGVGLRTSEITVIGNLFFDDDNAATAKEGNFFTFLNNTIVHITKAGGIDYLSGVVNVRDYANNGAGAPTGIGKGFYLEGNIIMDAENLVRNYDAAQTTVTFNNNILPYAWNGPGSGNSIVDPRLKHIPQVSETNFTTWKDAQIMRDWFSLLPGSPALNSGPNGRDKGGDVPYGASISGEPVGTTNQTNATLKVGTLMTSANYGLTLPGFPNGSGFTNYQWKLDSGAFSAETPTATPIALSGLANGTHTVTVIGKNDAGYYQNDPLLGTEGVQTVSKTWTVDTSYVPPVPQPNVVINEVLAKNVETKGFSGTFPDISELYNSGGASADLSGWGLTDNKDIPYKYTFPSGTTLAAGQYLVVYLSSSSNVPQPRSGFALKDSGDSLTLTKSVAAGGATADNVSFGGQLPDYSIGRRPSDGQWDMCVPTFGAVNIVAAQATPANVVINEWLTDARTLFPNDFIELYNPSTLPVNIGNCFLTDNPVEYIDLDQLRQLTFIAPAGYVYFKADGDTTQGPDHLDFKLTPTQGEIGFFDPNQNLIDRITYGPQSTDVSQGRTPNGASTFAFFNQPTPGGPNPGSTTGGGTVTTTVLVPMSATWKYDQTDQFTTNAWAATAFSDSAWPSGGATLGKPNPTEGTPAQPVNTTLILDTNGDGTNDHITFYFRTHFNFSGSTTGQQLQIKHIIDDGCVIYLNGTEVLRTGMAAGTVTYSTLANRSVGTYSTEGPFNISSSALVQGDNVIAVEVHQTAATSSDLLMAVELDSAVTTPGTSNPVVLNEALARNVTLQNPAGDFAGWIELYNSTASAYDVSDCSLTNDTTNARQWIFPAGSTVPANGYLVIYCNPLAAVSATNLGYALNGAGDRVYLFDKLATGGGLVDAIVFGQQLPDLSVGRIVNGTGSFVLNVPSRGAANAAAAVAQITNVKVNEWLALPPAQPGWFELYNTGATPVLLSGNYLTDNLSNKNKFLLPPLTFLGGSGASRWLQVFADNDSSGTPNHVNFSINPSGEAIGIFSGAGVQLEAVSFGAQTAGISTGRFPDGSATITTLNPTPAAANQALSQDSDGDGIPDWWENLHGLDPHNAADALLDTDGDGQSNLAEYLAGTDPRNPNDALRAAIVSTTPGQMHIQFTAQANIGYTIQYKNALTDATWSHLTDIAAQASAHGVDYVDATFGANPARFYRVVTPQQP